MNTAKEILMKLICKKQLHVEIEKDGIRHYDQLVKYFSVCKEKLLNPFTFKRLDFFCTCFSC